jgi:hypothetical protein
VYGVRKVTEPLPPSLALGVHTAPGALIPVFANGAVSHTAAEHRTLGASFAYLYLPPS